MTTQEIQILLVEDNSDDARAIQTMLAENTEENIHIDLVSTLADAYNCVEQNDYHVILVELSLPDSEGLDTLINLEAEVVDTPIIVLTGNEDHGLGIEAVQAGAQDYLLKSDANGTILIRSIRYAIERNQSAIAIRKSESEYRSLIDDVFDTSMVAVLILDRDFRVVWCNESTEAYFDIERERLLGRDKRKLIDEELKCLFADPDDYSARLMRSYEDGSFTERFECQVIPEGDRDERWLEHWSQPIRDGMYAGGRIEQYNDITDRKKYELAERDQRQFAEALRDINMVLTSSLELEDVFQHILSTLERIIPHDAATISLIEEEQYQAVHQQSNGTRDTQERIAVQNFHVNFSAYAGIMLTTGQPLVVSDMQTDQTLETAVLYANVRSYVGCPILLQEEIIGFIHLLAEDAGFFSDDDAERLVAFSRLAAIAIQNARLFAKTKQLAVHEERQRLARDLHDSVSQTLFTCRAMSESAVKRWTTDPNRAYELMQDVNQLTMTALSEMRILLLELRPITLDQISLKDLFEQYLKPIQVRRDFELSIKIDETPQLPPPVKLALYRITQEALNNIDKHAQAKQVEVYATNSDEEITLMISDDGIGFKHEHVVSTKLGLRIMKERAEEINAQIQIDSEPQTGTCIQVVWDKGNLA